jgi:SOS-response transcriptional repressor LexA
MAVVVAPPRRSEALAFIIERIIRTGVSPTSGEIARALNVSRQRAQQLVDQLIREAVIEKTPGSPRSLRIRDLAQCRHVIVETLSRLGFTVAEPADAASPPLSPAQLPMLPPFEHLPDPQ